MNFALLTDKSTAAAPATDRQVQYIVNLAQSRNYQDYVSTMVQKIIIRVQHGLSVSKIDASATIDALLHCNFVAVSDAKSTSVAQLLTKIPRSMYALPRKSDPNVWDFFEVVQRKNGRLYLNQLIGSPGDWSRKYLPPALQAAAARAILQDPKAAAVAYAKRHGRCAVCNAHLSDPASIDRSMGPICAKRFI